MKRGMFIISLFAVTLITIISGSAILANEDENQSEITIIKDISHSENEKVEVLNLEKESKAKNMTSIKSEMSNNRAIITSQWGTSPVTFDESTGILIVGAGELFARPDSQYLDNNNTIKKETVQKIILENGVVAPVNSVNLFSGNTVALSFNNLESIVGNLDTSQVTNMKGMFAGAENLASIDVSKWNTSQVTNMNRMFYGTENLASIDVSKWNTSQVADMNYMFVGATSLTNLDVSKWNTSKVIDMGFMFYLAQNLTKLDVSKWDTSQVKYMNSMFLYASSLASLDVSQWNTSQVIDMNSMFLYASSLASLDVSKWDTSQVTNMTHMFSGASSLVSLDVSKWDTSQVTDMSRMFSYTLNLANLDVSKWDTSQVVDMSDLFLMTNISKLTLGEYSIFNDMTNLPQIDSASGIYTGKWVRINPIIPISIYNSSIDFMSGYAGSLPGTYVWQKAKYSITYELDGGVNSSNNPTEFAVNTGVPSFDDPTKDGYAFLGWFNAKGNAIKNIPLNYSADIILYAKWKKDSTTNENSNNKGSDKLPQTGDSTSVSVMMMLLVGLLITGGYTLTRRKEFK